MKFPLVISLEDGKLYTRESYEINSLYRMIKNVAKEVIEKELTQQKFLIDTADFNDIVKWSK